MNTEKSPGRLAYEFHVSKRLSEPLTVFMEWHQISNEGKEAWESTAAFMSGGDAEPKENLVEPSEENIRYWTQRIIDLYTTQGEFTEFNVEKVIRELLTADTHYAAAQPQAAEGQRKAFEKWANRLGLDMSIGNEKDRYSNYATDWSWSAWQAAKSDSAPTSGGEIPSVDELMKTYHASASPSQPWNDARYTINFRNGISAVREAMLKSRGIDYKPAWEDFAKHIKRAQKVLSGKHLGKNFLQGALDEIDTLTAENKRLTEEWDTALQSLALIKTILT